MKRRRTVHLDLTVPRSIFDVLGLAFKLYGVYPGIFLLLSAIVIVPYNLIVIAIGHSGVITSTHGSAESLLVSTLVSWLILLPLIASFQMQALVDVAETGDPKLGRVVRQAMPALLPVIAAEIISGLVIFAGLMVFIVPGLFIAIRLAVVAPTAAYERRNWPDSIRDAWRMSAGNFWRILGLLAITGALSEVVGLPFTAMVNHAGATAEVIVITIVTIVIGTFRTLVTALLYFDLRAREE